MPLTLTTPPAARPVSLAEAKAHLKVDASEEDGLVAEMIAAATRRVEFECDLALITQRWRLLRDCWPRSGVVGIPIHPVRTVEAVKILTEDGLMIVDPALWEADLASRPARLRALSGFPEPARRMNVVQVDLTCGFGDVPADVPADLRQAVLLIVAHWFENREGNAEQARAGIPAEARDILRAWRRVSL